MLTKLQSFAHRARVAAVGLVALVAFGCGGGFGDPPAKLHPNEYGDGQHISSMLGGFQGAASWVQPTNINSLGCSYPTESNVVVTGATVLAVDNHDETGDGAVGSVYIQDTTVDPPIYAGISLFSPSFTPPDLRLAPGDIVDVTGPYEEFIGPSSGRFSQCQTLPQIAGAASFRFDGEVPAPVEIEASDLNTYDNARRYLGMLVKVKNLTVVTNGAVSGGRYSAKFSVGGGQNPSISDELFDVGSAISLHANDTFPSVTGIVTYFYGFHLAPRSLSDFER